MTAHQLRRLHLTLAVVWATAGTGLSILWQNSILWVAFMSVYAIVIAHLATYAGHRSEEET